MPNLSQRLKTIADMIKPCVCAADIGTDHAYIPIYLCKNNIAKRAVAGDISKGSAQKAAENVVQNAMEAVISVRCGGGLSVLDEKDGADSLIIAGMGGMLMLDILKEGRLDTFEQLVLQPQKDVPRVRKGLHELGFKIEEEKMVFEDGKYYNIISAVRGSENYTETEYILGKRLLENKDTVLKQKLVSEIERNTKLMQTVSEKRRKELEAETAVYKEGLKCL